MEEIYWYLKEHLPGRIVIKRSLRLKFDKIDRFSPTVKIFRRTINSNRKQLQFPVNLTFNKIQFSIKK